MKRVVVLVLIVVVGVVGVGFGVTWWKDPMREKTARTGRMAAYERHRQAEVDKQLAAEAAIRGPLEPVKTAGSERELREQMLDFFRHMTVESYRERGQRSDEWDDEVFALLELAAEYLVPQGNYKREEFASEPFLAAAERVVATECEDGMAMFGVGLALFDAARFEESDEYLTRFYADTVTKRVERSLPGGRTGVSTTRECRHQGALEWGVRLYLHKIQQARPGTCMDQMVAGPKQMAHWFCEYLDDPRMQPGDERSLFTWFNAELSGELKAAAANLVPQLERKPGVDQWLKEMVLGVAETNWAWAMRGGGWAHEVTEEGWEGFHAHQKKARGYLLRAMELRPEYPEAAAALIIVAKGGERGSGESPRTWFEKAVEVQFDHERAYMRLMDALLPRWGGSHEAMLAFAEDCLNTGRFDTTVPLLYWAAVQTIGEDAIERGPAVWRQPEVQANLKRLFAGMIAEPEAPWSPETSKRSWAGAAWRGGYYEDALRLLDELGPEEVGPQTYRPFGVATAVVRGECVLRTGEHADGLALALAITDKEPDRARAMLERIAAAVSDPDARNFAAGRALCLQAREALTGSDWLDITPDSDLAGWWPEAGYWEPQPDGSVVARHGRRGTRLVFDEPVEGNYEIEVKATIPENSPQGAAGIVLNFQRSRSSNPATRFAVYRHVYGTILSRFGIPAPHHTETPPKTANTLRVQVWDSRVNTWLNGQTVFENAAMELRDVRAPLRIGVGAVDQDWVGVAAIYHSVRVRRLTSQPEWFNDAEQPETPSEETTQ